MSQVTYKVFSSSEFEYSQNTQTVQYTDVYIMDATILKLSGILWMFYAIDATMKMILEKCLSDVFFILHIPLNIFTALKC